MSVEPTQVLPDEQDVASFSSVGSESDNEEGSCEVLPRELTRSVAGKRPRQVLFEEEEGWGSEEPGEPDLALYFGRFGLERESQVAMCRTYANYLAALARPKKYKSSKP